MALLFTEGFDNDSSSVVAAASSVYRIAGFIDDPLSSAQLLLGHRFVAAVKFPVDFGPVIGATSSGTATVAPLASCVITIDRCPATADPTSNAWSTIGTMSVAAQSSTVSFATSGHTTCNFALGDYMRWIGPLVPDASLAGLAISLIGSPS